MMVLSPSDPWSVEYANAEDEIGPQLYIVKTKSELNVN